MSAAADRPGAGGGERSLEVRGRWGTARTTHSRPLHSVWILYAMKDLESLKNLKLVKLVYSIRFGNYRKGIP